MDKAHKETDGILAEIEKRVAKEYDTARKDMQRKLNDYLMTYAEQDRVQQSRVKAGEISQKEYQDWLVRKTAMGKRWQAMRDTLAEDFHNANVIARSIVREYTPEIFALNHDFATYQIEKTGLIDTSYTLYDRNVAKYLLEKDRKLLPDAKPMTRTYELLRNKDLRWNRQKIQSAILQGIMQGEQISEISGRIRSLSKINQGASVRYARTMVTCAQNAGRYEGFRRAESMGVDETIEWQATLDGRTRKTHREMHGQTRKVDEPFEVDGETILYPGYPEAPQELIWNCRCTLICWAEGVKGDTVTYSPKMGDMTYEEWKSSKPSDDEQYSEYKRLLGSKAPQTMTEFRKVKYEDAGKWKQLVSDARVARSERNVRIKPKSGV